MIWHFVTADPVLTNNQGRREQNRAAQRAFRERKDKEIHSLRNKLAEIKVLNEELSRAEQLEADLARLQRDNIRIAEITLLDMGLRRLNMLRCDMNLIHDVCMRG